MDPSKLKHIRPIRGYHQAFQAYVMSTQFIPCCVSLRGTIMSATIVAHHCLGAPSYSTFVAMNSGHHPSANSGLLMNSLTACISHEPYMGQLPTASFPSTCSSRNMQSQNGNIMRISVHIYIYISVHIHQQKVARHLLGPIKFHYTSQVQISRNAFFFEWPCFPAPLAKGHYHRSHKVPQGPTRSHKVPQGPTRSHKVPTATTRLHQGHKMSQSSA